MGASVSEFLWEPFKESFSNIVVGDLLTVSLHLDDNSISWSASHGPSLFEVNSSFVILLYVSIGFVTPRFPNARK